MLYRIDIRGPLQDWTFGASAHSAREAMDKQRAAIVRGRELGIVISTRAVPLRSPLPKCLFGRPGEHDDELIYAMHTTGNDWESEQA